MTNNLNKYSPEFLNPDSSVIEESRRLRRILPPMSPWHYGWKYVDELSRFNNKDIPAPTSQQLTELKIKIVLEISNKSNGQLSLNEIYETVSPTVDRAIDLAAENPAVFDFFMSTDYIASHGVYEVLGAVIKEPSVYASEFFIPWRVNSVPRAECLEFAYGYAPDWFGNMRKIPPNDLSYYLAFMDPLFGGIIDRGVKVVEWLKEEKPKKIIFAPAGLAPEFRHLGLTLDKNQTAVLIDRDPTIEYDVILSQLPFRSQISTIQGDLIKDLRDPRCIGADALVCTGFLTYVWDKLPALVSLFRQILRPGGTLILDANASHWVLPRNEAVSFYQPMKTFETGADVENSLCRAFAANTMSARSVERYTCHGTDDRPTEFVFRIKMPY